MHKFRITLLLLFLATGYSVYCQETKCIYHISFGNLQCDYEYGYDRIPILDLEGNYNLDTVMYSLACHSSSNWNIILDDSMLSKSFCVTSCDRNKNYTVLGVVFRLNIHDLSEPVMINIDKGVFDSATISYLKKYFSSASGNFSISIIDSGKKVFIPGNYVTFQSALKYSCYDLSFYQWQWKSLYRRDTFHLFDIGRSEVVDTITEWTATNQDTFQFHCAKKPLFDTVHLVVTSADGTLKYEVKEFTLTYIRPHGDEIDIKCKGAYLPPTAKSIFENCTPEDFIFLSGIEVAGTNAPYSARLYGVEIACVK